MIGLTFADPIRSQRYPKLMTTLSTFITKLDSWNTLNHWDKAAELQDVLQSHQPNLKTMRRLFQQKRVIVPEQNISFYVVSTKNVEYYVVHRKKTSNFMSFPEQKISFSIISWKTSDFKTFPENISNVL